MTTGTEKVVTCVRDCPSCGKATTYTLYEGIRAHVRCPFCGFAFEVSTITRRPPKRGTVGGPVHAGHDFDYAPASSHNDPTEFIARMHRYANEVTE